MLNKLGIGLKKTKDGAWDVVGEYKAIANAVASQKSPQVQALIANNLGLGGMLPFLREGAAGIERYEDTVRRLGYVMSDTAVKQGKEFSQSLASLNIAVDGTKNAIGDKLIPVIKPLVDQFTNWLAANRELIATNIADWAKGFATWINKIDWKKVGDGIINFGKGVGKVVDWLGGWQNAALLVVGVMNAGLIAGVLSLGVTLLKGGAGILSFIGILWKWQAAATATAAAQGTLTASAAAGFLGKAGFVGAAGAAGYGVGTMINNHFVEGTKFQGWLGDKIARGLAFFGNDEAKQAVAATDLANGVIPGGRDKSISVSKFFEDQGWTKAQATGIAANLGLESNFSPSAYGDGGSAYGLGQWHQDRQQEFAKWQGKASMAQAKKIQLRFVQYELTQGNEKAAGISCVVRRVPRGGRDCFQEIRASAAADWEAARRGKLAEAISTPAPDPAPAPAGPYTQGAAQAAPAVRQG